MQEFFLRRDSFHALQPFSFGGEAFGEALIGEVCAFLGPNWFSLDDILRLDMSALYLRDD